MSETVATALNTALHDASLAGSGLDHRPQLLSSEAAHQCHAYAYLTLRWASDRKPIPGDRARRKKRERVERDALLEELRDIGITVHSQFNNADISYDGCDGHLRVDLQAAAMDSKYLDGQWHVVDVVPYPHTQYQKLIKDGLLAAFPFHYSRMQLGMHFSGLSWALHIAMDRDTYETTPLRLPYDEAYAKRLVSKELRIIYAERKPVGISVDYNYFQCAMCAQRDVCHGVKPPLRNCRTCARSVVEPAGGWGCSKHKKALTEAEQRKGCEFHRYVPSMLAGTMAEHDKDWTFVRYMLPDGTEWTDRGPA